MKKLSGGLVLALIAGCSLPIIQDWRAPLLLGEVERAQLERGPYAEWFSEHYENYESDSLIVRDLKAAFGDVSVSVFIGTWCGDTKRQLPRLFHLLDELALDNVEVTLVGLDRDKVGPSGEERTAGIHHTPTVIVRRAGAELGRIIETPVESLERDLLKIIKGEPYTPHFQELELKRETEEQEEPLTP